VVESLPFPDASFDGAERLMLHHLPGISSSAA